MSDILCTCNKITYKVFLTKTQLNPFHGEAEGNIENVSAMK